MERHTQNLSAGHPHADRCEEIRQAFESIESTLMSLQGDVDSMHASGRPPADFREKFRMINQAFATLRANVPGPGHVDSLFPTWAPILNDKEKMDNMAMEIAKNTEAGMQALRELTLGAAHANEFAKEVQPYAMKLRQLKEKFEFLEQDTAEILRAADELPPESE